MRDRKCCSRSMVTGRCSIRQVPIPFVPSASSLQTVPVQRPQSRNVRSSAASRAARQERHTCPRAARSSRRRQRPDRGGRDLPARRGPAAPFALALREAPSPSACEAGRGRWGPDDGETSFAARTQRARNARPCSNSAPNECGRHEARCRSCFSSRVPTAVPSLTGRSFRHYRDVLQPKQCPAPIRKAGRSSASFGKAEYSATNPERQIPLLDSEAAATGHLDGQDLTM